MVGLQELKLGGKCFTYMCDGRIKLSKLDRYLVCAKFIAQQPFTMIIELSREHFDHTPLVLKPTNQDFGPPLFRFFNSWIHRDDFDMTFTITPADPG